MIAKNTVLILGAGASLEYGFPSGEKLLKIIHANCLNPGTNSLFLKVLSDLEITQNQARLLAGQIEITPIRSIDALLEHHTTYIDVGKAAIATSLLPMESPLTLHAVDRRSESWYQYLWDCIQAPTFEKLLENQLTIITYNYDRSLDFYLRSSMKAVYGKNDAEVTGMMNNFKIIHLHGSLGDLQRVPYACPLESMDKPHIKYIVDSIRVIHEPDQNTAAFAMAKSALRAAEQAVFLGFGYHKVNLQRLLDSDHSKLKVFGTAFEFTEREIRGLRKKFPNSADLQDMEILEYLRETCVLVE